jgi:hypothetical protein
MTDKKFTPEEMEILRQNKYILNVTPCKLSYTLEFKQFVLKEATKGTKSKDIFIKAGFDPEIVGVSRIYAAVKAFKKEAKSPEGLRASCKRTRDDYLADFAKEDYSKKHTKTAIRDLQKRIVHLEQQIEFLKKIQSLDD